MKRTVNGFHYDFVQHGDGYLWTGPAWTYHSKRYNKDVTIETGYYSDGSTGWLDMIARYFWVHDILCERKTWDDGSKCSRWQASMVLGDVAREDGCYVAGTAGVFFTWVAGAF